MLVFRIELDTQNLPDVMKPSVVARHFYEEIEHAIRYLLRQGKEWAIVNSPLGATGAFKGSVVTDFAGRGPVQYDGEVAWNVSYADTVVNGGPPRRVPIGKLTAWSAAVLGSPEDATYIQAAIMKRGTPSPTFMNTRGHHIDNRLFKFLDPLSETVMRGAADKIGQRLSR